MVDAGDDRHAIPGQREAVEPPERSRVVEPLGEQLPDRTSKLLIREWIRMHGPGDVPVEIDVVGIDPGRAPEPEPGFDDPLSQARIAPDSLEDPLAQLRD